MSRSKIYGFIACIFSIVLAASFFYNAFFCVLNSSANNIRDLSAYAYYAISIPIIIVTMLIFGLGFWVGWTILSIKVVPTMPELGEKKDYARIKAFFLCLTTLLLAIVFIYGVYVKSYWALAIPAATVTLVILGMIFWVGTAIIFTRSSLPESNKQ